MSTSENNRDHGKNLLDRLAMTTRTAITVIILIVFAAIAGWVLVYAGWQRNAFDSGMQVLAIVAPFVTLALGFWFGSAQAAKSEAAADEARKTETEALAGAAFIQASSDPMTAIDQAKEKFPRAFR